MTAAAPRPLAPAAPAARPDARPPRSYRAALQTLSGAQKAGAGVPAYTRWVNRRLARYAAAAAYRLGWGPNTVTAVSALTSALGLAVLLATPPSVGTGVGVAALLALGYLLDSADGQVARLSRTGSRAGEWLDHVVDAYRTPAIHGAVLVALLLRPDLGGPDLGLWPVLVALLYSILSSGQAMNQMLAEQLSGRVHRATVGGGNGKSLLLLPTDTGVLCWLFLLWGAPTLFVAAYTALFLVNATHSLVSMRRKYTHLAHPNGAAT